MRKIRNFCWLFIGGIFGIYASVFAQNGTIGGGSISLPNPIPGCSDASCVVTKVINFILVLATPICAIMVLWGGFTMMTAGGDPEKFSTGRKTILYAAVGFVAVLLANSVAAVVQNLFK